MGCRNRERGATTTTAATTTTPEDPLSGFWQPTEKKCPCMKLKRNARGTSRRFRCIHNCWKKAVEEYRKWKEGLTTITTSTITTNATTTTPITTTGTTATATTWATATTGTTATSATTATATTNTTITTNSTTTTTTAATTTTTKKIDIREQLLRATNEYRNQNGREPLATDMTLHESAQSWANELAQRCFCEGPQCHSPDNKKPPGFMGLAENVYMECNHPPQAMNAIDGWKKSPIHNKNMLLSQVTNVGFGVGDASGCLQECQMVYVVALYGLPSDKP